ncbi:MAG: leucyl aminopeptidase, partial [Proteobacteria bacterium]|nr:leucyl aminopeptidase [Pseudomonadota bacterium]
MEIEFIAAGAALPEKSALALVVFEGAVLDGAAGQADAQAGGALARAASAQRFTGAKGQVLDVLGAAGGAGRILLVGAGKKDGFDDVGAEHAAASADNAV